MERKISFKSKIKTSKKYVKNSHNLARGGYNTEMVSYKILGKGHKCVTFTIDKKFACCSMGKFVRGGSVTRVARWL